MVSYDHEDVDLRPNKTLLPSLSSTTKLILNCNCNVIVASLSNRKCMDAIQEDGKVIAKSQTIPILITSQRTQNSGRK